MKTVVVSYSLTGNNDALAAGIASGLNAKHVRITENRQRNTVTIVFDVVFNRSPRINPAPESVTNAENVIFIGPVWMGKVASPFRAYFRALKGRIGSYAFVSISGGALGPNPKLGDELFLQTGKKPVAVLDHHVADLMPAEPKPTIKTTSSYRLNESDRERLINATVGELRKMGM